MYKKKPRNSSLRGFLCSLNLFCSSLLLQNGVIPNMNLTFGSMSFSIVSDR